jgi:hypothetical protein
VALNRYVIFGKYNQCLLPSSDHKGRFIDSWVWSVSERRVKTIHFS